MEEKKTKPHLFNLNFDPQLSGRLGRRRLLNVGSVELGKKFKVHKRILSYTESGFSCKLGEKKIMTKNLNMIPFNFVRIVFQNFVLLNTPKVFFYPISKNKYQV
jgi:hypothetical protein